MLATLEQISQVSLSCPRQVPTVSSINNQFKSLNIKQNIFSIGDSYVVVLDIPPFGL